jgi:hypothetical protein
MTDKQMRKLPADIDVNWRKEGKKPKVWEVSFYGLSETQLGELLGTRLSQQRLSALSTK